MKKLIIIFTISIVLIQCGILHKSNKQELKTIDNVIDMYGVPDEVINLDTTIEFIYYKGLRKKTFIFNSDTLIKQ